MVAPAPQKTKTVAVPMERSNAPLDVPPHTSSPTTTVDVPITKPEAVPFGQGELLKLPSEVVYILIMSWKGKKYDLTVVESDTVGDLKVTIWTMTSVPSERQKIVGLVKGKLPSDEVEVKSCLTITPNGKPREFMMIGTPEGEEHKEMAGPTTAREQELDIDYNSDEYKAAQNVRNMRKLKQAIAALTIDEMNPPRAGKKLLVLDLDYCILDTDFARPYLHQFLGAISPFYDIVIWSQTSWRWLETKLVELDIIGESAPGRYNIITTLDRTPMFSVYSQREGKPYKHEVKALPILWAKFPNHYSSLNTIHVDDLARNFAINPRNGLRVKAYKDAMRSGAHDDELVYVAKYLLQLVHVDDFTALDHARFRKCRLPLPQGTEDPVNWVRGADGEASAGKGSGAGAGGQNGGSEGAASNESTQED
ncbi:BQ2448_401 [Microbotryum intermedium]|uniref:BQ2448_401 protein n=1 Tax=Microbotryum intermedium TaxID=269621 RepID=A0A238F2C5_9BASI|nr:BQ2448_401 [Microbotryum intermedium]